LLGKEFTLEWRQRFAVGGLALYAASMVIIVSLTFSDSISVQTWNILFWLIVLFSGINVVAKSFHTETVGQSLYMYTLVHPVSIILSKMIYNMCLLAVITLMTLVLFSVIISDIQLVNVSWMLGIIGLGSFALSANLTLVSAIAARADNRSILLAVLSFPLIIPTLLTLIRETTYALDPNELTPQYRGILFLGGFAFVLASVATILFPFLWRD